MDREIKNKVTKADIDAVIKNIKPVVITDCPLDRIAGYKEEKAEVLTLINLLKNYKEYEKEGIYVPKGLILQGPPGCGKTLFARAIAHECGVNFFSFQAEASAELSLAKLQATFKAAKATVPSILYIDEVDKLVNTRYLNSADVRIITQYLLTELDGLDSSSGLLVIASTNEYDELPNSLVRSGRMDKKLYIALPDYASRVEILHLYMDKYDIFKAVNVKNLAIKLKTLSGADIKTLINNVLIAYAKSDKLVEVDDFKKFIDEMHFETVGKQWHSKDIATKVLAHEAGHSIVSYVLTGNHGSISGIKYGDIAGHTDFNDDYEDEYQEVIREGYPDEPVDEYEDVDEKSTDRTKQGCLNSIAIAFGGMVAEELFFGASDGGCRGDMNAIASLTRFMAFQSYMGMGLVGNPQFRDDYSPEVYSKFLRVQARLLRKQKAIAKHIVKKNKYLIRYLIDTAKENNDVLSSKSVTAVINDYNSNKAKIDAHYKKVPLEVK